jgi:HSP20 family protein
MANVMTKKTQRPEKPVVSAPVPGPYGDFPFFLGRLRDEFNQLLDRCAVGWLRRGEVSGWRWGIDVRDEAESVVVEAEAPGFEAGDLDIQIHDNRLSLRAMKKTETESKEGNGHEYHEQRCYQFVTLPPGIDPEKVKAVYHNGILTVTLPKAAPGIVKKVSVQGG